MNKENETLFDKAIEAIAGQGNTDLAYTFMIKASEKLAPLLSKDIERRHQARQKFIKDHYDPKDQRVMLEADDRRKIREQVRSEYDVLTRTMTGRSAMNEIAEMFCLSQKTIEGYIRRGDG